ncbi:MAG TPA: hypothetical protein VIM93_00455 [Kangiella sp.]
MSNDNNEKRKKIIGAEDLPNYKEDTEDEAATSKLQEHYKELHKGSRVAAEVASWNNPMLTGEAAKIARSIMEGSSQLKGVLDEARGSLFEKPLPPQVPPSIINIEGERHEEIVSSLKAQISFLEKNLELEEKKFQMQRASEEESRKRDNRNRNIAILTLIAAIFMPIYMNRDIEGINQTNVTSQESVKSESQSSSESVVEDRVTNQNASEKVNNSESDTKATDSSNEEKTIKNPPRGEDQ